MGPKFSSVSLLVMFALCDHMDCSLPGSSSPWNFAGKNTGVGCLPFSRDFPDPGIELRSPALPADSVLSELSGKPKVLK